MVILNESFLNANGSDVDLGAQQGGCAVQTGVILTL